MVHANDTRLEPRAVALGATSSPANAEVLGAVWDLVESMMRSRQAAAGAAPSQAVLIKLVKLGPTRVCDLAAEIRLDQSTVSRHLANLVDQGLVERMSDPTDRRAHLMSITDAGTEAARAAIAARVARLERVLADWPDHDRAEFARLLNTFTTQLDTQISEGARP